MRYLIFSTALLIAALAGQARAESCTLPTPNALTLEESFDEFWTAEWCGDSAKVSAIWNGLHLDSDDFKNGWGYYNLCNPYTFLNRLMSSGQGGWNVLAFATPLGDHATKPLLRLRRFALLHQRLGELEGCLDVFGVALEKAPGEFLYRLGPPQV